MNNNILIGAYIRLSKEDSTKVESNSITNQRFIIDDFVSLVLNSSVNKYYIDDGETGTNFDRDGFKSLENDILSGDINCVIVKDLSRLGRNHMGADSYMLQFFPAHNVRFIAVNDNYDSEKDSYDIIIPIKNLFNEQYSRDMAKKVQSAIHMKQKKGQFIGAFTPYGYLKNPNNRNKLIEDEYAASIVKRIFKEFVEGKKKSSIAKGLNNDNIVCPSEYKRLNGMNYINCRFDNSGFWTYSTINYILHNEVYIGNMVQGKADKSHFSHRTKMSKSKDEWIVVKNTHGSIVQKEIWNTAQILLKKSIARTEIKSVKNVFSGFLKCGDCGRYMVKINVNKNICYCCATYKRYGACNCTYHKIEIDFIEKVVLRNISMMLKSDFDLKIYCLTAKKEVCNKNGRKSDIKKVNIEINNIVRRKRLLYNHFQDGIINREEYIEYKKDYEIMENIAIKKIELFEFEQHDIIKSEEFKDLLYKNKIQKLDKILLAGIIDYIEVEENNRIMICFTFKDELKKFASPSDL